MKRKFWKGTHCGLLLGLGAVLVAPALAAPPGELGPIPQDLDLSTRFDANAIDMWTTNQGSFSYDIENGTSGLIYPKGSQNTVLFASGLWVGARVGGDIRVTVAEYSFEYAPGVIEVDGSFDPTYTGNPHWRTYKIDGASGAGDEDWDEWPVEDGAPVDDNGDPLLIGDQTLWSVYHDADPETHGNDAGRTDPLGVEVQQTTFGFNLKGPLENVVFIKYLFINKSQDTWDDTYVSLWSDPDLGGAGDDYVGSDTTLSVGYCYNATNTDNQYGSRPPAVGFDFFQGPIVPSPGDTAFVSGVAIPDFRNLPMVSFNKYINGTDPSSFNESYNYMQGLLPDGSPVVDPVTGLETRFQVPGDPTSLRGEQWLDSNPADRRFMLSAGPFTMAPGDTQEVVTAVVLGQGADRLTSITAMKFNDSFAQAAFDVNFDLPKPPPAPVVSSAGLDGTISLHWGEVSETDYDEPGYSFEGYNVYQLAAPDLNAETRLIATFDVVNGTAIIFDDQFDAGSGVVVNRPVQFGQDGGVERTITLQQDALVGQGLRNGKEYYFNVTAYSYGPEAAGGLRSLESSFEPIIVVPQAPTAGTRWEDGEAGSILAAEQTGGSSDAVVIADLIDPTATSGDDYVVSFDFIDIIEENNDGSLDTLTAVPVWNLNTTTGRSVLGNQRNLTGDGRYLVEDGIMWRVVGALPGWKRNAKGNPMIDEILNPDGPVEADGNGGPGNDVWHSFNSNRDWLMSAGGGDGGEGRFTRDGGDEANLTSADIIMKWDNDANNYGWWAFEDDTAAQIPFGLYLRDPTTQEETQLIVIHFSGGHTTGLYEMATETADPFTGWPGTDYAYAYTGDYATFAADAADGVIDDSSQGESELFARCIIADGDDEFSTPPEGTIIQFSTTKPPTLADEFTVRTSGVTFDETRLKADLSQIRVVPNPYRNQSTYELNQFNRIVKFTHLPDECRIRIFTLAGDLVRTLDKNDSTTSILEWNLQSARSIPVASGVYIYHVEAMNGGRAMGTTTGKLVVFMEKERLNFF